MSFSELTNTEANCLEGTKEHFDENHPCLVIRTRRLLACPDNFRLKHMSLQKFIKQSQSVCYLSFVNDAEQLKQVIRSITSAWFYWKSRYND